MKLNVFFGNEKAGSLESTENRGVIFVYDKNYLLNKNALPLSASLPLQSEEFPQKQCIPVFAGFLPEENSRKKIADYLHISETSTLKLLEALNGAPSTHILKPTRTGSLSSLAKNEYICMKLAKSFALPVPNVDLLKIAGKEVFVVERYDRINEGNSIQRLHQEDFCQALGIISTSKYQNDGGPGIADIFNTITKVCTVPALESQKFLRYVLFNYLIGNCDSHGKNYSLLYKNRSVELSPLYDVVSTVIYPGLTEKLSMKIGKHYEIQNVTKEDFSLLAETLNIKYSVFSKIFDDFGKKYINAFEELKNDKKVSTDILNSIFEVVKSRF